MRPSMAERQSLSQGIVHQDCPSELHRGSRLCRPSNGRGPTPYYAMNMLIGRLTRVLTISKYNSERESLMYMDKASARRGQSRSRSRT